MSKDGTQHRDRDGILKELCKICTKVCIKKIRMQILYSEGIYLQNLTI